MSLLKNSFATLITRGLSGGIKSILYIMIAKTYDPTLFGKFALVLATLEVFRVVADIGIGTTSLRRFSRGESILKTAVMINILSSTVAYITSILFIAFLYADKFYTVMMIIAGMSLFISSISNTFYAYYHSKLAMSKISGITVYGSMLSVILTSIALHYKLSLYYIMFSLTFTDGLSLLLIVMKTLKKENPVFTHTKALFHEMIQETIPLFFSGIFSILYLRTNVFVLSFFKGESEVGTYAAPDFIIAPFLLVCSAVSPTLFAIFSKADNKKIISELFKKYLTWTILTFISFPIFISISSFYIVNMIIPNYHNVQGILIVLGWVAFLKVMNIFCTQLICALGCFYSIFKISVALFICNALTALVAVQLWGAIGAAYALATTELIQLLILSYLCNKLLKI